MTHTDGTGEREAAGLLSSSQSRINNGAGTRSQEMVYHAAEELLHHQQNEPTADDQPRRRSVNYRTIEPILDVVFFVFFFLFFFGLVFIFLWDAGRGRRVSTFHSAVSFPVSIPITNKR